MSVNHFDGGNVITAERDGGSFAWCGKKLNGTEDTKVNVMGGGENSISKYDITCKDCMAMVYRYKALDRYGEVYFRKFGTRDGLSAAYDAMKKNSAKEIDDFATSLNTPDNQ